MKNSSLQEALRKWFIKHQRKLPFRNAQDPYLVWISEVMSQQTRMEVIKDYFIRFIKEFPTIQALANSSLEKIIKLWEGLGYYARARNLQLGARQILTQFQGNFPQTLDQLLQIKGIGPYSARAILSFAFHQKTAPVDGNVIRVLTRFYAIDEPIETLATKRKIQQLADQFLPEENAHQISEALIELGSLVCKQAKPLCALCPLKAQCVAKRRNAVEKYPVKKQAKAIIPLQRTALIFVYQNQVFVKKNQVGLMKDLYEFPTEEGKLDEKQVRLKYCAFAAKIQKTKMIRGYFTNYKLDLHGFIIKIEKEFSLFNSSLIPLNKITKLPFSSAHRRLAKEFFQLID